MVQPMQCGTQFQKKNSRLMENFDATVLIWTQNAYLKHKSGVGFKKSVKISIPDYQFWFSQCNVGPHFRKKILGLWKNFYATVLIWTQNAYLKHKSGVGFKKSIPDYQFCFSQCNVGPHFRKKNSRFMEKF